MTDSKSNHTVCYVRIHYILQSNYTYLYVTFVGFFFADATGNNLWQVASSHFYISSLEVAEHNHEWLTSVKAV